MPERLLADMQDPLLEENEADINVAGQLENFGDLLRRNQAEVESITMRENEGRFLELPEDRSDDFFGAPPASLSEIGETAPATAQGLFDDDKIIPPVDETAPATAQGLFDDDNIIPPVDVTAAANDDAETAVPDAPLRTNGIANPEDASETPAVEEADGQAGGRRRPRKRPPPFNFTMTEDTSPIPDADVGAHPPTLDAQPDPEIVPPPSKHESNASVPVNVGPVPGIEILEGENFDLPSVEKPDRRPKQKRRKKMRFCGGPMIDLAGNMQVNIKANLETGDETLIDMQELMPQKKFPSLKELFDTAARKCLRSEILSSFRSRALREESELEAEIPAEPDEIAMQVDAPLGQSDMQEEPHSRLRAGTSINSLAGESGSIQGPDFAGEIETSMLSPIQEIATKAKTPFVETSQLQPQEEMNVEQEVAPPADPTLNVAEDNADAEMMPPPPLPIASAPGAESVRSEESGADSLPTGACDEMGPIEREVIAALSDMGHGGRGVPFDTLVDDFKEKRSVAKVFGLLLSMEKRRLIDMKQEEGTKFGGSIVVKKIGG